MRSQKAEGVSNTVWKLDVTVIMRRDRRAGRGVMHTFSLSSKLPQDRDSEVAILGAVAPPNAGEVAKADDRVGCETRLQSQ